MTTVLVALFYAVWLYQIILLARIVFSFILNYSREWRPKGVAAAAIEIIWTLTDPPVKFVRSLVKPIKIGQVQLDLSIMIVLIATSLVLMALQSVI